jgi:hypothetical protein
MKRLLLTCLLIALPVHADDSVDQDAETGRCLPPTVGAEIQKLIDRKAFATVTPAGWELQSTRVLSHRIELSFADGPRTNRLALIAGNTEADAHGQQFSLRVLQSSDAASKEALLRAGQLVDAAIPASSILECQTQPRKFTRARAIGTGALEALALLVACLYGVSRARRVVS